MKRIMIALALAATAFAQEKDTEQQVAARIAEFNANTAKVAAQAKAFRGTELPHYEVQAAKAMIELGYKPQDVVSAPASVDTLIWTSDEMILTGYAPNNIGQVTRLGLYAYNQGVTFNRVSPVGDARNTVLFTGWGYDGNVYRYDDPSGSGIGADYISFDGGKDLDALLALSPTQFVGNSAYGNRMLSYGISQQGLNISPAANLNYVGSGSIGLAKNSKGDIASIDVRSGIIWILRKGTQYADILYGVQLRATAITYGSDNALYVSVAGQAGQSDQSGRSTPYLPSRIVKLVDNGPGQDATLTEVVSGGLLNISYGANSVAVSGTRIYFTNNTWDGRREIDCWDMSNNSLSSKVPPALARGVNAFALMPQVLTPTTTAPTVQ